MTKQFVCAVDVGTGSARAGILDSGGNLLGRAEHPIAMHQPKPDHAEHDSQDIWSAVCRAVRAALKKSVDRVLEMAPRVISVAARS